jgi:peptidoglycan/LPS O-acetylase OafA/YrhL
VKKTYFPGLNALRFYAALSVIIYHFTAPTYWFGDEAASKWHVRFIFMDGRTAVTLFFVLSGFLILYLLIREKDMTGSVSVKQFYIRRIFRILPLYYLTLFAGAIIVLVTWNAAGDAAHKEASNPLYWMAAVFFLYNFLYSSALPITHLWSLNVEEQFYLIAPRLIKSARSIPATLIGFAGVKLGIELGCHLLYQSTGNNLYFYLLLMLRNIRFESMALGGLAAYLVYQQHPLLRLIFHPIVQVVTAFCFMVIAVSDLPLLVGTDIAVSFIFALVIVNTAAAPRCFYRFETPMLRQLGDLSYSLYMAHAPILWLLYAVGARGIVFQTLGVVVTLGAAYLLHRYFEQPFMRLRDRMNTLPTVLATATAQLPPNPHSRVYSITIFADVVKRSISAFSQTMSRWL